MRERGKSLWLMLAFLAPLACASPVFASSSAMPAQHPHDKFNQIDTNNDGKIVLEEFNTAFPNMNNKAFLVIDTNNDGVIDQTEWVDFMDGHAKSGMPALRERGAQMNNIPGDPLIPPVDSNDLPLMRPPGE